MTRPKISDPSLDEIGNLKYDNLILEKALNDALDRLNYFDIEYQKYDEIRKDNIEKDIKIKSLEGDIRLLRDDIFKLEANSIVYKKQISDLDTSLKEAEYNVELADLNVFALDHIKGIVLGPNPDMNEVKRVLLKLHQQYIKCIEKEKKRLNETNTQ